MKAKAQTALKSFAAALFFAQMVPAQPGPPEAQLERPAAAVTVDGRTLFRVRGVEAYPAEQRARAISSRIEAAAADPSVAAGSLRVAEVESYATISAGDKVLMAVTETDASFEGVDRRSLMPVYRARIAEAIDAYRRSRTLRSIGIAVLYALGASLGVALAVLIGNRLFRSFIVAVEQALRSKFEAYKGQQRQFLQADRLWAALNKMLRFLRVAVFLLIGFFYAEFVLSLFPWTRGTAAHLLEILLGPLRTMGQALVSSLPGLMFLVVLMVIVRYALRLTRLFFDAIESRAIAFSSFDPEWAKPTYHLIRVLTIAFAAVIAYPYLPGSSSDAFKGVSLFLGLIFSLGSSSAVANIIAGYTLTYRRAYRIGDRVKIGDALGDVMQFRLQATYIRSLKNEEIVIPNSEIIKSFVTNYSTMAKRPGLILHSIVAIGYETPWRQVEAMLLEAAQRTPGLLREPGPFVRQKSLGDFAITYEINVYCDQPQASSALYSALHGNILDIFNEYGVQIMTPAYVGDPPKPKLVPRDQQFGRVPVTAPSERFQQSES